MTMLLAIASVSKRFGGVQAVRDLSFVVDEHEILGLIGPNGAGKSTLFNLINGVFPPNSGRIVFAGAVRPDQPKNFALAHGEAQAVHGKEPAEASGNAVEFEERRHSSTFCRRGKRL